MRVMICLKPVPEPGSVRFDPERHTLKREGTKLILNPPDRFALESAVSLAEEVSGRVTAVSMGPPNAEEILVEALACGADEAYLLSDRAFAGSDTLATSYVLSLAVRKLGPFDLVLCGKASVDGETAQVGPEIAAWLGWPSVIWAKDLRLEGGHLLLNRLLDQGEEVVELGLPAVVTVEPESSLPRPPSVRRLIRARRERVPVLSAADLGAEEVHLGLSGSPTQVIEVFSPAHEGQREVISGPVEEVVESLVNSLRERGLI